MCVFVCVCVHVCVCVASHTPLYLRPQNTPFYMFVVEFRTSTHMPGIPGYTEHIIVAKRKKMFTWQNSPIFGRIRPLRVKKKKDSKFKKISIKNCFSPIFHSYLKKINFFFKNIFFQFSSKTEGSYI